MLFFNCTVLYVNNMKELLLEWEGKNEKEKNDFMCNIHEVMLTNSLNELSLEWVTKKKKNIFVHVCGIAVPDLNLHLISSAIFTLNCKYSHWPKMSERPWEYFNKSTYAAPRCRKI